MVCIIPQIIVAQSVKPKNLLLYDNQPYHFGFILAYNQMSYSIKYNEGYQLVPHDASEYPSSNDDIYHNANSTYYVRSIMPVPEHGFTVGIVGNLRLSKHFDLRLIPSLSFGSRTLMYQFYRDSENVPDLESVNFSKKKSIFSTFIEIPLQVKFRSKRLNNVAAYLIAGGNFKIDLASRKKSQVDIQNEQGELISVTDNIRVKRTDLAAEFGAGFDFYTGYFKFGIEVKMSYGLFNIMDSQNLIYDSSIKSIQNKTFQVSLTFE